MRVVLAGSGLLGGRLLRALLKSHHEIVAILQNGRRTKGWKRTIGPWASCFLGGANSVAGIAKRRGIPILWLDSMTPEALDPLRRLEPDLLLVGGFGIILKKPLLDLPRIGCLNVHSSLLPRHRGPNPFSAVLLAGDQESGVTFHIIDEGIDTGDIVEQLAFPITENDTTYSIYKRASKAASDHILSVLSTVEEYGLAGYPQDASLASYDPKPTVEMSWIDWNRGAEELSRMVRALSPLPLPRFRCQSRVVCVARVDYSDAAHDAAPGTVLKNRPFVSVATARGVLRVRVAFCAKPFPWFWPAPWSRPAVGTVLE